VDKLTEAVVTVFTAIIGVAILSVLVSPKAQTSQVVQSVASGFGNSLAVAMTPVTGERVQINTSYPSSGNNIMGGMPQFGGMGMPSFY
jgi:Na+-translocating ferredoxin:NAD+ oxidoreductase RnfA subunit